jgi:DNA-directed RNA polymerase specialized sigma24 family protein
MINRRHQNNSHSTRSYATNEDFKRLFAAVIDDLFRLSLQLTADADKAKHCLALAMADCFGSDTISTDFAHVWARRMVIQNAIHLVLDLDRGTSGVAACDFHFQAGEVHEEEPPESIEVLHLPEFDRLAYVICALERLAIQDCALLLRKSPKDVKEAIARAANRIASVAIRCRSCFNSYDSRHSPPSPPVELPFVLRGLANEFRLAW